MLPLLAALIICCCLSSTQGRLNSLVTEEMEYCPYFGNRAPQPQPSLRNCTWYRQKACCLQEEIDVAFSELDPLPETSEQCMRYLNYLYCYICAPKQNSFLYINTLTVCEEFCNEILQACSGVMYKGMKLGEFYSSGKDFCEGRRYNVVKAESQRCFSYDPSSGKTKSNANGPSFSTWSLVVLGQLGAWNFNLSML